MSSRIHKLLVIGISLGLALVSPALSAEKNKPGVRENTTQVKTWNKFADDLLIVHDHLHEKYDTYSSDASGDYGGSFAKGISYTETSYFDKKNGQILTRVRQQRIKPADTGTGHINSVEVYIYDESGSLVRDYLAAYIPGYRNAPIQTLINFHKNIDDLSSFRQFDASGRRIYEQCKGKYFDETVDISLEDYEIPNHAGEIKDFLARESYRACFDGLPVSASNYLNPLNEIIPNKENSLSFLNKTHDYEEVEKQITRYTQALYLSPRNPGLYLKRADAYLLIRDTEKSIDDYTNAIRFDPELDEAYFGRGMAYGRAGEINKAIADLTVYIKRNPESSLAYTKRGVRRIWAGELKAAEIDLKKAVALDPSNSEAHDDLGVLFAQRKALKMAARHFHAAIKHDPSYQKAYHNLAMVYYLDAWNSSALKAINTALALAPNSRNSLLLKSEILKSMGKLNEASKVREIAEFLPKGNWSEQFDIQ
ncbi:MAG: tetratricopeptide repeat protein [Acidiferrobacterales bacterium]